MERIATSSHQNLLTQQMLRSQATVAAAQIQSATGLKSTTYAGISSDSSRLINLEDEYKRSERYVDQGEVVNGRIQTMYDAVGGMVDLTARLSSLVTSLQGAGSSADAVQEEAAGLMEEFAALLNTRSEGRYLFAGSRTDTAPVDLDSAGYAAVTTAPTTASTGYYHGDSAASYFQAADELVIDYGAAANEGAFEQALRAFNLLSNLTADPLDTAALDEVSQLASDATEGLAVIQTRLGTASATLERAIDGHVEEQLTLQTQVDDIKSIDLAEVTSRLSTLETSLQATMSLMKIMDDNNLMNYL